MTIQEMKRNKQQKGYTFAMLAELSGIPQGTIQKIFNGETKSPRYDTLQALEKVLGMETHSSMLREPSFYMANKEAYRRDGREAYTLKDYYARGDEERSELIDGVFYDMVSPSVAHQLFVSEMSYVIRRYIHDKKGMCLLFTAPTDVQLDDEYTVVRPDIMVLCDRKKIHSQRIVGAPDFVVEILSPSTRYRDAILKLMKYRSAGVREYWIVDIDKGRIVVYFFEKDELPCIYGEQDEIPVGIYGGNLKISMHEIFEAVTAIR